MPFIIQVVLQVLVANEVCDLEGNVHAKLCGVAAVESSDAFHFKDSSSTVEGPLVRGVVHLKTLLDHWRVNTSRIEKDRR